MIRATTPTHSFEFEMNPDLMSKILITYNQDDQIVLEKEKTDMTFRTETRSGVTYYIGYYTLTQKESNKFQDYIPAEIQIRVLTTSGEALASTISTIDINRVLNDEVLENEN